MRTLEFTLPDRQKIIAVDREGDAVYPCPKCLDDFYSDEVRQAHIQRAHP
jgi:uncharacterized C2H2 Zn-finger protein